jgi:hypothetical protein
MKCEICGKVIDFAERGNRFRASFRILVDGTIAVERVRCIEHGEENEAQA